MKLNPSKRKPVVSIGINSDARLKQKLQTRLVRVSETVRRAEIDKVTEEVPQKRGPENRLRVTVTRKLRMPEPKPDLTLNLNKGTGVPAEALWKARRFTGRHLPVLACNSCSISRVCPKFKAGYECAFLPYLNSHKVETPLDLVKYMKLMVGNSMKRAQLMSIVETANGGMPSVETSESLDMAFRQLKDLHEVMNASEEETVQIEGDATVIGQIFGGMKLQKVLDDTAEMKANEPILELPEVPLAVGDVKGPMPADVSADLIREAILNDPHTQNVKNSLPKGAIASIAVSEFSKS